MIANDQQLDVVREQIATLECALAGLRSEVTSSENFAVFAEPYADQIHSLRAEVDAYLCIAPVADLSIRLKGEKVELGTLSAGTVSRYIDALRRGVQAAVGLLNQSEGGTTQGRNPRWVEQLCDFPIAGLTGGSVSVLLGKPEVDESLFSDEQRELLGKAFGLLFDGLSWTGEKTSDLGNDDDLRAALLSIVANLLPPASGDVEEVEIGRTTQEGKTTINLTRDSRKRLRAEMERLSQSTEYVEVYGDVRRVDLDRHEFLLKRIDVEEFEQSIIGSELRCEYGIELEGAIKDSLDQVVCVAGPLTTQRRTKRQTLSVDTIEVLTGPAVEGLEVREDDQSSVAEDSTGEEAISNGSS